MKCKACGYEGDAFPRTPMGKYCCPQCGAGKEETVGQPVNQSVADYAAMLEKLTTAPVEITRYENTQEFARLDAWGRKNAAFLNQFNVEEISEALWADKYYYRPEGWSDQLWRQDILRCMQTRYQYSGPYNLYSRQVYENDLGFEVLYAAGGVIEFRLKKKNTGFGLDDGRWHTYYVPCRFIDGDVRPLMDGCRMKPSGLLKTEKIYRFKG